MTRLRHILVIYTAVVGLLVLAGCRHGQVACDARLVQADSLIAEAPDSALAVLEGIDAGSLATDADRAYLALLTTQARYRAYIPATSDSLINVAVDYYDRHSSDREKLTRALIYKGAVMEELGNPEDAMRYYKQAETAAESEDLFNQAYCKIRIATLYQQQLSSDSSTIRLTKEAYMQFNALNDTNYMMVTSGMLGAMYGKFLLDSAVFYLHEAIRLSQEFRPSEQYDYISKLAGIYFYRGEYTKAKNLAINIIENGQQYCGENQYFYYAAASYVKLGQLDSARYIQSVMPLPECDVDSMNYYQLQSVLAEAANNYKSSHGNFKQSQVVANKIITARDNNLKETELTYEKHLVENEKQSLSHHNQVLLSIIIAVSLLLLVCSLVMMKLHKSANEYKTEYLKSKTELNKAIQLLKDKQKKIVVLEERDVNVSKLVSYRLSALNELYQNIRVKAPMTEKVKKIITFSGFLQLLHERKQIINYKPSDTFWESMRKSVDGELNGIVTFVEENYKQLTQDDINLFCMYCANISPQIIKLCFNYSNAKTVSNYKRRLLKEKMGLDMSLEEFIAQYLNHNLPQ